MEFKVASEILKKDTCAGCILKKGNSFCENCVTQASISALDKIDRIVNRIVDFGNSTDSNEFGASYGDICNAMGDIIEILSDQKPIIERKKATPIKPIIIEKRGNEITYDCPACGMTVIEQPPYGNYCRNCGQKMDWGGIEQ